MIKNLLQSLGYIQESEIRDIDKNPLSEDEVFALVADVLTEDFGEAADKEEEKKLFLALADVDGFVDYLRNTAANDIRRFFQATSPQQQLEVRGAFARTIYLKGLTAKEKRPKTKLKGKRYGK